jgi:hypothetical protein
MKKILTATLAVAIALAPASAITQGVITGQQTYVTGSKPDAEPGKYKVVKIKKAKAVHRKHSYKVPKAPPGKYKVAKAAKIKTAKAVHHHHSYKVAKASPGEYKVVKIKKAKAVHRKHSYKVAKAPHYAKHSYYHPEHHWQGYHYWFLPALLTVGLGLFRLWH